ncbi:hypothetical protein HY488_01270 [Candidatus Woesearchaeota archaeon]|nr:hypothetical protein [Candidatus Woesearchaeota archaeon]
MIFNERGPYNYASAMDREYVANTQPEFMTAYHGMPIEKPIHGEQITEPILTTGQIGQTVSEGPGQGTFLDSVQAAIRKGAKSVELSISTRAPGTGPDFYTKDKLREIREMAKANQVELVSVHVPVEKVSNLSGFAGINQGFVEEQRFMQLNEVKKAIKFAAETTNGGAIVVHTGEFQRVMSEQPWARTQYGEIRAYEEEPERFVAYLVDDRTGRVVADAKKTQVVYEPIYVTASDKGLVGRRDPQTGHVFREDDWLDINNQWVDPTNMDRLFDRVPKWNSEKTRFETQRLTWDNFVKKAEKWNRENTDEIARDPKKRMTPEEMYYRTVAETNELQYRGSSLFYAQNYEQYKRLRDKYQEALKVYEDLERQVPEKDRWKLMKQEVFDRMGITLPENIMPSEYLKREIKDMEDRMRHTHEASSSADARADQVREDMQHIKSVAKYAKDQSVKSYTDAVLYAIDVTQEHHLKNPLFIAPENILPEMGYGSHPDELIELVQLTRKNVAEKLMRERGMSLHKAEELANRHVMATLDTEHLGIWRKHFQRRSGESEDQFTQRFNGWYMEQVKKMQDANIIGHIHIADGFGYENANLPAGTGILPVVDAVKYLMKRGYSGPFLSEGYGDAERMLRDTWKAFGSPIYSLVGPVAPGSGTRWSDVQHSYFGHTNPPNYVFGAYSPSNDWTLWSQTPME